MNELLNKTISQIVTEHHQTANVFEKYGIDFCCKGKRPLLDACTERQLNKEEVILELENAIRLQQPALDFNKMKLTDLADYIVGVHHTYVRFNMPQISEYVTRVATKHGDRFPFMKKVAALFLELQHEMTEHMIKEERILFPRIKQLETEQAAQLSMETPISVLVDEHEKAGALMQHIRELTNNYTPPADACTTFQVSLTSLQAFEKDLHQHVHLENYILFPKALALYKELSGSACQL